MTSRGVAGPGEMTSAVDGSMLKRGGRPARFVGEPLILDWIPSHAIPKRHRSFVREHVDRLARSNGFPRIDVRWFRVSSDQTAIIVMDEGTAVGMWWADAGGRRFLFEANQVGEAPGGVTHPDWGPVVAINADLRGAIVAGVLAHEVQHLVERRAGLPADEDACTRIGIRYASEVA
jgi:hypothetical protein